MTDRILILDFGSQVTQLIARRVREAGVYCEIWPYFRGEPAAVRDFAPSGIILSGGPASVIESEAPQVPDGLFGLGLPVLGAIFAPELVNMCFVLTALQSMLFNPIIFRLLGVGAARAAARDCGASL